MDKDTEWHLSKTVPIVWYVSSLDNSVKNNAREILRHEVRIDTLDKVVQSQALTLARIDENIKSIRLMMEDNRRD